LVCGILWAGGSAAQADTVEYQVAASGDDTYTTTGGNYPTSTTLIWPYSSTDRRAFMRWQLDIPAGATIQSAYVKVCANTATSSTRKLNLQLLDYNDCPAFAASSPHNWSVSGGTVEWTLGTWAVGSWYTSPDIAGIVSAFINRGGYAPGKYLGLRGVWTSGTTSTWARQRDYSGNTYGAKLEVTYTPANASPTANAGVDQTVIDYDYDEQHSEVVVLDGSGSSDSDGMIVSYVWTEGGSQIATGQTASVTRATGTHTITLTVTDDDGASTTDVVVVTVNAPTPQVVELPVEYRDDDCAASLTNGANNLATTMYWPYTNGTEQAAFARWHCLVPDGATITEAYVKVKSTGAKGNSNDSELRLRVLDYDSCPKFSGAVMDWPTMTADPGFIDSTMPGAWVADTWYSTENLADLVQNFIDRDGYAFGNYIGLVGRGGVSGSYKQAYNWDYTDHSAAPKLEIHYVGGPAVVELYMADPEVRLRQKIYCQLYNIYPAYRLRAKLDGQEIYSKDGPLSAEEIFVAKYVTDEWHLHAGEHTLLVEVLNGDQVRGSASRTWTTLHDGAPTVGIDENNSYRVNGQLFFPIMAQMEGQELNWWTANDDVNLCADMRWLAEHPDHSDYTLGDYEDYLDDLEAMGLRNSGPNINFAGAPYGVEMPQGHLNDQTDIEAYVVALKNHNAVFQWVWSDEPDGFGQATPPSELREWTDLCHANDTNHPHYVNLTAYYWSFDYSTQYQSMTDQCRNYSYLYGADYFGGQKKPMADVLGFDYYPVEYATKTGYPSSITFESLASAMDRFRAWQYDLVPFFLWIEYCDLHPDFNNDTHADGPPPEYDWTAEPTEAEVWLEYWVKVIHGAKGFKFHVGFALNARACPPPNHSSLSKFKRYMDDPELLAGVLGPDATLTVTDTEQGSGRIDIMAKQTNTRLYVFAANLKTSSETVRFDVEGLQSGDIIVVYDENRAITAQNGYFTDSFASQAVHIYQRSLTGYWEPYAEAGSNQVVTDSDESGAEMVALDGSDSVDYDGTIASYVWKEGTTTIATGSAASVSLDVGMHTLTLVVTDNQSHTDQDTVQVVVNARPVANASTDQQVLDIDVNGSHLATLNGSGSSDSDGTITSYVWSEGGNQIATGQTPTVNLTTGTHTITLTVTDFDGATDSDTVVVTVAAPGGTHVAYQVTASANDAYATSTWSAYNQTTLFVPYSATDRRTFARWSITIPDGSTIICATVRFKSNGAKGSAADSVANLQLVDSDSCPSFSAQNPFAAAVTGNAIPWTVPAAWTADTWYYSPDIGGIVQAFIDRGGYVSGNYLGLRAIWVSGPYKTAYQWDTVSHTDGAVLDVYYTSP
jgi:hypothetical protein